MHVCMHTIECVYLHACMCVCVCVLVSLSYGCILACKIAWMHEYRAYIHQHAHVHVLLCVWRYVCVIWSPSSVELDECMNIKVQIYTSTYIHKQGHAHTHTHTHMHAYSGGNTQQGCIQGRQTAKCHTGRRRPWVCLYVCLCVRARSCV